MIRVKVSAPATIANLGPGFDILGLAVKEPRDTVELIIDDGYGVEVESVEGVDAELVTRDVNRNTTTVAIKYLLDKLGIEKFVKVKIWKGIPIGVGLGSSGAAAAAAIYGMARALNLKLEPEFMIECAAKGEEAVTGTAHADNVAPSLLGGLCAILSYEPLKVVKIEVFEELSIVIARPSTSLPREEKTRRARELLPKSISLRDHVRQCGSLLQVILGFIVKNCELLGKGVSSDYIVEPARSVMIPGFYSVKKAVIEAGAYGCSISGAGPSIFAICSEDKAKHVGEVMREEFTRNGVERVDIIITKPSNVGAKVENY